MEVTCKLLIIKKYIDTKFEFLGPHARTPLEVNPSSVKPLIIL